MPDPSYHTPSALEAAQASQASAETLADSLRISELRYRRLFEAARDGILILDVGSGKIIDANPFMSELLGYSYEELLGKELWEIGLLEDKKAGQKAFRRLRRDGYIRYDDLPLESRNGGRREVEFICNAYRESGFSVIQCNIRDVTDRKRIEAALAIEALKNERIAETLQRSMLQTPVAGRFPKLAVETLYQAALNEAEVGGDFFDAFAIRGGKVALVVGDVSGKGLIAAARTAEVKYALRAFLHICPAPEIALQHLNEFICEEHDQDLDDQETFIILSVALLDPATGEVACAAAGAEPSIVLRASGKSELVEVSGSPLGVIRAATYAPKSLLLAHGETLLMATDGITEARHDHSFLGVEGMANLAEKAGPSSTLQELSAAIYTGARDYAHGALRDDVCLLLARRQQP
ncbi:MAG: SpoIIE family protein phosphatase [Capsulimonadaceae bacterium]|nr:SpoIIE family protein phosphatase [Capsulimonadaceae bacterium]